MLNEQEDDAWRELNRQRDDWKSRALAAERQYAFLREHVAELLAAWVADEGEATAGAKLVMAFNGGPAPEWNPVKVTP